MTLELPSPMAAFLIPVEIGVDYAQPSHRRHRRHPVNFTCSASTRAARMAARSNSPHERHAGVLTWPGSEIRCTPTARCACRDAASWPPSRTERLTRVTADPEHPNGMYLRQGNGGPRDRLLPGPPPVPHAAHAPQGGARSRLGPHLLGRGDGADRLASGGSQARHRPEAVVFACATAAGTSALDFFPWVQRLANAFGSPNSSTPTTSAAGTGTGRRNTPTACACPARLRQRPLHLLWGVNAQASQPADACGSAGPERAGPGSS